MNRCTNLDEENTMVNVINDIKIGYEMNMRKEFNIASK